MTLHPVRLARSGIALRLPELLVPDNTHAEWEGAVLFEYGRICNMDILTVMVE